MQIKSAGLGDFVARARAEEDTSKVGPMDLVLVAVKTYDNPTALPMLRPMLGADTVVLTVQNGVDSAGEVAAVAGEARTLGGTTYIATALEAPGLIVQNGDHRASFLARRSASFHRHRTGVADPRGLRWRDISLTPSATDG